MVSSQIGMAYIAGDVSIDMRLMVEREPGDDMHRRLGIVRGAMARGTTVVVLYIVAVSADFHVGKIAIGGLGADRNIAVASFAFNLVLLDMEEVREYDIADFPLLGLFGSGIHQSGQ